MHEWVLPADRALAVEHAGAARHQHAVGGLGLAVGLDDLGGVEEVAQRALRRHGRRAHRRRSPCARSARTVVGDGAAAHHVEDHAADQRQVGDGEALRGFEHGGDVELLEQHGASRR